MESNEVRLIKGAVHLGLALTPLIELKHSTSKLRTALLGLAAGWHLSCANYHFFIEGKENNARRKRKPRRD